MGLKSAKQQKFIKYHVIFSSYNIFLIKEVKVELEQYITIFAKRVHEISDHYFKEDYYQKMRQIVDKLYSKIIR